MLRNARVLPTRFPNFTLRLFDATTGRRSYTTTKAIIHIPRSNVYRFGDPNTVSPVFRDLEWTVKEDEAWAIVGTGSGEKATLFQTLLGHLRITPAPPPPDGLFPFLSATSSDPYAKLALVSFGNRSRAAGGAFYDFSARYGAVRDDDRITLRQSMFPETIPPEFPELGLEPTKQEETDPEKEKLFEDLMDKMGLRDLLDIPLIALSNGQTRRARIVKAILQKPELLLLDEPLTGLDVTNRPTLLSVLHELHSARAPRIIFGLRTQDAIPEWVTHVAFVKGSSVIAGPKDDVIPSITHASEPKSQLVESPKVSKKEEGALLVDMRNVNVKYGVRHILKDINWQVRQGERWHLQGTNGSGKTTLLSILTGSHPQSYTQSHLQLHSRPRSRIPTPLLASLTGLLSPELFDAFPRRHGSAGMSVWEAIGTGFDGGYVPKGKNGVGEGVMGNLSEQQTTWRVQRMWEVLEELGPGSWEDTSLGKREKRKVAEEFKARSFAALSTPEQRIVLLMRALVGRPPLVLLDEVWSGMGEGMVRAARKYLREGGVGEEQGVVVITHWQEEVPWEREEGVRKFVLEGGKGRVVD